MKNWFKKMVMAAALTACCMSISQAQDNQGGRQRGQGGQGGPRDPEEMRARMAERMREQFGVTDDAEWKIIEGKIEKVNEARRASGGMGMGGFGGGFAGRGPGGPGGPGGAGGRAGGDGGRRFGPEPAPEVEALQKAVEAKAPADEIKAKLAKVRELRKANEAKLEAAQEDLRKVLSVRQEAVAVMMGLVK